MASRTRVGALGRAMGLGFLLCATGLTGCVGQGEYDNLYETNAALKNRNAELTRERDEFKNSLDLLRSRLGSGEGAMSSLEKQLAELTRQRDQALADYKNLEGRLAGLSFGPVDADTDAALKALADQYPDLIRYDSARGMLRFASDLTFDSGSDVVKSEAAAALRALAQILNSSSATAYEVVIEGHTDSQRISSGTAKRHATNRHLSVHRSIAVINELANMGVQPGRLMAAGWGEHHPTVQNSGSGNTPQNRRVEIFLAKARGNTDYLPADAADITRTGPTNADPDNRRPPTRQPDISK